MAAAASCFSATTTTKLLLSQTTSLHSINKSQLQLHLTRNYNHIHVLDHKQLHNNYSLSINPYCKYYKRNILQFCTSTTSSSAVVQEEEEASNVNIGGVGNTKLYFGNLPYNVDSSQLAGIIQEYASPELIEVLYDRDTGKSRGFAFVTMSSMDDALLVIDELDGSEFCGRILKVNFSDKPKPKEPLYPDTEHKLFVGNLSWTATSESLMEVFKECGDVVGARVLYDGETGRSRGYGFVCFSTKDEMLAALDTLNGVELEGRAMRISIAQGKRS